MKRIALSLCASALSFFPGCMSVGNQFTSEVKWIQPNKTTRTEVERRIGTPFRVGYDTGMLSYEYGYYRYSLISSTHTKDLTVRFNPDNTVNSYSFSSNFEEDKTSVLK